MCVLWTGVCISDCLFELMCVCARVWVRAYVHDSVILVIFCVSCEKGEEMADKQCMSLNPDSTWTFTVFDCILHTLFIYCPISNNLCNTINTRRLFSCTFPAINIILRINRSNGYFTWTHLADDIYCNSSCLLFLLPPFRAVLRRRPFQERFIFNYQGNIPLYNTRWRHEEQMTSFQH